MTHDASILKNHREAMLWLRSVTTDDEQRALLALNLQEPKRTTLTVKGFVLMGTGPENHEIQTFTANLAPPSQPTYGTPTRGVSEWDALQITVQVLVDSQFFVRSLRQGSMPEMQNPGIPIILGIVTR